MCGICGFLCEPNGATEDALRHRVTAMADTLAHRGPDGAGIAVEADTGLAFGHRRLAILDLSAAGNQPMADAAGNFLVTYNGEIYNFQELRAELEATGVRFRSRSDTEVLVEACARWGVVASAARLNGIFAFAVWDRRRRTLSLVRDQLGIKPLYWARRGSLLLFGSELKALRAHPGLRAETDPAAVAAYLRYGAVPAPATILRDVHKLEPGCLLEAGPDRPDRIIRYWDLRTVVRANRGTAGGSGRMIDEAGATEELYGVLADAVRRQLVADVPVGVFLSGGIDSSTVAALAQAASSRPIRTFTVGFSHGDYDEASHARAVARHLGTDHTEMVADPAEALALIPRLSDWYDEPFADSSALPTYLVSRMTRGHVTVALSGDGGDELFGGYNRYLWAAGAGRRLANLPPRVRHRLARLIRAVPPDSWDRLFGLLPARLRPHQPALKLHKAADTLAAQDLDAVYRQLVAWWPEPPTAQPAALAEGVFANPMLGRELAVDLPNPVERMQFLDSVTYLPDDILTKVDRASMAVALEARVPLLDPRVVALAWQLPFSCKIHNGVGKRVLRQVLYRHVPQALVDRPKSGFAVPLADWLAGPLRDWAETLLAETALRDAGLDPLPIRRAWDQQRTGTARHEQALWAVLMLQAWRERWNP